jgi:adenylate cyclase
MARRPAERRLAAILAADVAGYTRLMEQDTDGTVAAWQAARDDVIEPTVAGHSGRMVKLTGDGFLVEFPTVLDAVRCAIALQEKLAGSSLDFRIGVNLGDIVDDGRDIHGEGVNIAARIEALADPGGISISGGILEQVRNRIDASYEDRGEHQVKHVSMPVRVYAIRLTAAEPAGVDAVIGGPVPDRPSIAVLPFGNMSGDAQQEYFADGITEDIITELSKIDALFVISRNSTFTYKGKAARARDICRDLGVRHVLEGSVRKAGNRVRITAQLIDGRSDGHLWAERFDRELVDIFAVQDEITEKIVAALEINLIDPARSATTRVDTGIPEAYDCLLRGREQYRLFSREGNDNARRLFQQAIELDPTYAAAHAGLAEAYLHDWFLGVPEALDRSLQLALEASALDPSQPLALEALGNAWLFNGEHEKAIAAARQWTELEPSNADAHANLAAALNFGGEPEKVIALIDKAMRLNPYYPFYYILYKGQAYLVMKRYEDALEALRRSVAHNPDALPPRVYLAACLGLMDRIAPAHDALANVFRIAPEFSTGWVRTFLPYRRAADSELLMDGLRKAGLSA